MTNLLDLGSVVKEVIDEFIQNHRMASQDADYPNCILTNIQISLNGEIANITIEYIVDSGNSSRESATSYEREIELP